MTQQLLLIEGVNKEFPGVKALSDMHLNLNAGEVHAVVGENGAGKSTLMKILTLICNRTTIFFINTRENLHQSRFASSIFANNGMYFAFIKIELHIVERFNAWKRLAYTRE